MSDFDKDSLKTLQDLCKIKLTPQEIKDFLLKLKNIIDYVEKLDEIDTKRIDPCNYVLMDMQKNVFREDKIKKPLEREEFLKNAPDQVAAMIKVPEILSSGE